MTTFSDRLKQAMTVQNMKQIDLVHKAAQSNVKLGKSHVSQYVSGKTIPRNDILHFLADTLQVDSDWLLGDSQETTSARRAASATSVASSAKPVSNTENEKQSFSVTKESKQSNKNSTGDSSMYSFKKSSKLDNVLYDVRGPVVEEAARMEERGTHVLKLNIGNPAPFGFRTPDEVIYDMSQQLSDCEGYSPSQGLFSARKAIMQYSQIKKLPMISSCKSKAHDGTRGDIPQGKLRCCHTYCGKVPDTDQRHLYLWMSGRNQHPGHLPCDNKPGTIPEDNLR